MCKEKRDDMNVKSFISSKNNRKDKEKKKKKKKSKCVIKETNETDGEVAVNKDLTEEETNVKNDEASSNDSEENSDDSNDESDISVEEDDSDSDEDDEDDDEDEDDEDGDGDEDDYDMDEMNENLYNMLNEFLADEYGVSVATSMSNIAFELHSLNKNISKLLKDKEKK